MDDAPEGHLLVDRGQEGDGAMRAPAPLEGAERQHEHRQAALVVDSAAPVEPAAVDARGERIGHAVHLHGVEVPLPDHRLARTAAAELGDQVGTAGLDLVETGLEARRGQPVRDKPGKRGFAEPIRGCPSRRKAGLMLGIATSADKSSATSWRDISTIFVPAMRGWKWS